MCYILESAGTPKLGLRSGLVACSLRERLRPFKSTVVVAEPTPRAIRIHTALDSIKVFVHPVFIGAVMLGEDLESSALRLDYNRVW